MANILDDKYPINIAVSQPTQYENFLTYTKVDRASNPIFNIDPSYPNRITVTNLPRGGGNWYIRKPMLLPNFFTLYYKLTLTNIDMHSASGGQGGHLPLLFTRDPGILSQQQMSIAKDGWAFYARSYTFSDLQPYLDVITREYHQPIGGACNTVDKKVCLPTTVGGNLGTEYVCTGIPGGPATWQQASPVVECTRIYREDAGPFYTYVDGNGVTHPAQTMMPIGVPRWIKIQRIAQTDPAYAGSIFNVRIYSDENYINEIPTNSLLNCYTPDTDPYLYFIPVCCRNGDTTPYNISAVLENFFFTTP